MTDKNAQQALEALMQIKATLVLENEKGEKGAIVDTIWHGPGETLLDYIDNSIAALESAAPSAAEPVAIPKGWLFKRNDDGSIGIFGPPSEPGKSQRTSDAFYPRGNRDMHELLGRLADHMAAPSATSAAPTVTDEKGVPMPEAFDPSASHITPDYRDGWNACHKAMSEWATQDRISVALAATAAAKRGTLNPELQRIRREEARATLPAVQPEAETSAETSSTRWNEPGIQAIHALLCTSKLQPYELACAIKDRLAQADAPVAEPVALPKVDLRKIAEEAGICMDLWDMGAASLAHSEGCEGVTRADLERFAALYGFACWKAALVANPPNMQGMVDRALDSFLSARPPAPEEGKDAALGWRMVCGDWRDELVAIHGPGGHIVSGLTSEQASALIAAHGPSDAGMAQGER